MPSPAMTLLASSLVFPSFQFQETGFEGLAVDSPVGAAHAPFVFEEVRGGFGLQTRTLVTDPKTRLPRVGSTGRLRFRVDENDEGEKRVFWEDVTFGPGPFLILARPDFGTIFDLGIGPFQNDAPVWTADNGTVRGMLFLPLTFMPAGLANTDQDDDKRLKYYLRAGAGLGGTMSAGAGAVFLDLRLQGDYRWTWRAGSESTSHHRGEVEALGDIGIGFRTGEATAALVSFFYQDRWQWDYDGPNEGLSRSSQTLGGRVTFRTWTVPKDEENRRKQPPETAPAEEAQPADSPPADPPPAPAPTEGEAPVDG